jgi:holo-[acyl-carrier protein] synthase
MILGIGSDICDIRRVEKTLTRHAERFENRVFTQGEQAKARSRKGAGRNSTASTYAKRFAAKEACGKALGTGVGAGGGIYWKDIEVVNLPTGKPTLKLSGNAKRALDYITPKGMTADIQLTLVDEYPMAQAFVIIQAL